VKLPKQLPLVKTDGEWLVELLVKLLDNASKFTPPEGKITIQVSQPNPAYLQVTIADTGRGIEPSRLDAVFDRFYQEEGALRRTTGGTGLGLAMCRHIIEGLGGRIWAESSGKNQGSQFHFTLPVAPGQMDNRDIHGVRSTSRRASSQGLPSLTSHPAILADD
jgi:signal transduction histidine kinase